MLSTIRNYQKGLLIIVTILLCAAFGWFFSRADTSTGQRTAVIKVGDTTLTQSKYQRIENQSRIAGHLMLPGTQLVTGFMTQSISEIVGEEQLDRNAIYPATIQLIRNEAKRLGIAVSDDEVNEVIRQSPTFMTNGQFDKSRFDSYQGGTPSQPTEGIVITQMTPYGPIPGGAPVSLSQHGLNAADVKQVIRDYLSAQKLVDVVGAGIQSAEWSALEQYEATNQIIISDVLEFNRKDLEASIDTSDEALTAFYEENKDRYMTAPRLVVQYAVLSHAPQQAGEDETADQIAERLANANTNKVAMRRKADELYELVRTGTSFEEAAATHGVEPVMAGPFEMTSPPAELREAQRELFSITSKDSPVKIVNAPTSSLVILVKDFIAPEVKPFEDVRDQVKTQFLSSNAADLARESANAARTAIAEAAAANSTAPLAELKASAGVEGGVLTSDKRLSPAPETTPSDRNLRIQLTTLPVGTVSEVIETGDGFLIALIRDRQIERSETRDEELSSMDANLSTGTSRAAFLMWWQQQVLAANPRVE